jgi:hypothetical protein
MLSGLRWDVSIRQERITAPEPSDLLFAAKACVPKV